MNKFYNFLSCLLLLLSVCSAVDAQTIMGYSNGTASRKKGFRFGTETTQGMAIRITAEKAALLKNAKITGVTSAFGTSQIQNLKIFVTKHLDGAPLLEQTAMGAATSWKNFNFDTPYVVDGEAFYVGYTFEVATTYKPLLFDESNDMSEGYSWVYQDGEWIDASCKGAGVANIRLLMEDVPAFTDMMMKPVDATGYYKQGENYTFVGQLLNFGTTPIHDFEITCSIGETEPIVYKVGGVQLATGDTYDFVLPEYRATASGRLPFVVSVRNINGGDDADESDNVSHAETYIYPEDVKKKVLIETFTGQTCGNCPSGHSALSNGIKGMEDEFVVVSHHSGYNPDIFTTIEDVQYTWLYNSSSLYAPACMFNRTPYDEGTASVVFIPGDTKCFNAALTKTVNTPPYVGITLDNTFDADTQKGVLSVRLHTYERPSDNAHRLNVFLIQNNIEAYQSNGGANYNHSHVFRDALTEIWGDSISLNEGETVELEYVYHIPDSIESTYYSSVGETARYITAVPKDMQFVVFTSDVANSALACKVHNVACIDVVAEGTSGIAPNAGVDSYKLRVDGNQLSVEGDLRQVEVYNMQGRCVANAAKESLCVTLPSGVYVVRVITAVGKMHVQKILSEVEL